MKRREFIGLVGGAAAWPLAARAQGAPRRPVVACLFGGSQASNEHNLAAFFQGMQEHGYVEGRNFSFLVRYGDGDAARQPALAEELVRLRPDVAMAGTTLGAMLLKKLSDTLPIIGVSIADPIGFGMAASHNRPGGNVTGLLYTVEDLPAKQLALAIEMVPGANKIGLLVNSLNPTHALIRSNMEVAAKAIDIELAVFEVRSPAELQPALQDFARANVKMVVVPADAMFL